MTIFSSAPATVSAPNTLTSTTPDKSASCALIGYNQRLSVSAGGMSACLEPNTYQRWTTDGVTTTADFQLATAETVNFVALVGHNADQFSGIEIEVLTAATAGGATVSRATYTDPTDQALYVTFDDATIEEVKIDITNASTGFELAYVMAGQSLVMPNPIYGGHNPIDQNASTQYKTALSETGQFLGRSIQRRGFETGYSFQHIDPTWYRSTFAPFVEHCKTLPFFIKWRPDLYDKAVFAHTTSDFRPVNMSGGSGLMQVNFNVRAYGGV